MTTNTSKENNFFEDFFTISHVNNNSKTLGELLALSQKTLKLIERNQASEHPFQVDNKRLENLFNRFALYHNKPSIDQEEQEKKMELIKVEQSMSWLLDLEDAQNFPTYLQQFEVCCGDERILGFLAIFYRKFANISEKYPSFLKDWADFFTPYLEFVALKKFNFEKIFKFQSVKKTFYNGRIELNRLLLKLGTDLSFPSVSFEDSFIELQNLKEKFVQRVQKRNSRFYMTLGQMSFLSHLLLLVLEKDRKVFQLMCIWTTLYFGTKRLVLPLTNNNILEKIKMNLTYYEDQKIYFPYDKMKVDPKCWVKPLKKSCYFLEENSLEPDEILLEFAIIESFLYLIFTNKLNETALFSCSREEGSGMLLLKIFDLIHSNQEILRESKSPICGNYGDFYESLIWILLQLAKVLLLADASSQKQKHNQNIIIYKLVNLAPSLKNLKPFIAQSYFSLIKSFAVENKVIRKWLKVNCNFFPVGLDQYLIENGGGSLALHLNTIALSIKELSNHHDDGEIQEESKFVLCQKKLAKIYKNFLKELSLLNKKDPDQMKIMGFFLMEILHLVGPIEFPLKKKFKFLEEFFNFLLQKYNGPPLEVWDFYLLNKHLEKIMKVYPELNEMVLDQLLIKIMLMHKKEALLIPIKTLPSLLTFIDKLMVLKERFCNQLCKILNLEDEINSIMKQHSNYIHNLVQNKRDDILVKQDIKISLQKFVHYTVQWTGKYLMMLGSERDLSEILEKINLLIFNSDLFILLEDRDKQAICFFYENIVSVRGFTVMKKLYEMMTEKLSSSRLGGFKLLVGILSKIDLSAELMPLNQKMYDALGSYLTENLKILENDFVIGVNQLVQISQGFEPAKSVISKFCTDLSSYFKTNSEEINSRYLLNIISKICQESADIFFSLVIKDLDLWTILIQKINKAMCGKSHSLTELISIHNFLSISLKLLQDGNSIQIIDLSNRLKSDMRLFDIDKLCRVNCKTIIQTVLQVADILELLENNLKEEFNLSDAIPLMISMNALGNKYNQIQDRFLEKIKQSPLAQESFFLHLKDFLNKTFKMDEKLPIYNQTLIFHALWNLSQSFAVQKELLHEVYKAAVILFRELNKQNLQEMNKGFHLISKTDYFALMADITENITKSMLTSYTNSGEKSAQTAEFIASWVILVFKFYDKINPNNKILKDKPKLTKGLLDLLQLAVQINSFHTQQFILNNTFLIQELLAFYETEPFEPSFLNALAFTFDAFASHSISEKIFTEMKLKQTLISKTSKVKLTENPKECKVKIEKIANDYIISLDPLYEQKSSLSHKIQGILNNISPNMKMMMDILTQTLLDNHLYNLAQINKQKESPKSLTFKNTTPLFTIISTLIAKYPHLAVYLWFVKKDYKCVIEKYSDLKISSPVTFIDCLFELGYFDIHESDIKLLVKTLCHPIGIIFVDQQTFLDASYLVISQVINSSIQTAHDSLTIQERIMKFYTALKFFALISAEIEQSLPKESYLHYFSPILTLAINKFLYWWAALDKKILECHSYYQFPTERKSLCSLLSSFLKNFIKRKLSIHSIKQDTIHNFKSDDYICLLSDSDCQKAGGSYFQKLSQKIDQDLHILSKIKISNQFLREEEKSSFIHAKYLEVPACKDIPIFQESSSKDFELKLSFLHLTFFYYLRSKPASKQQEKPKLASLELYMKANSCHPQFFEFQPPNGTLDKDIICQQKTILNLRVQYFFHETIQNELELSNFQRNVLIQLKLLSEQTSLKLGRFGSTGCQFEGSKELVSQGVLAHLDSLSCFEKNLTLCFIQEFAIFNLFELPSDIDEIKKEYHWMKSDFSSYLQNLNQIRTPIKKEEHSPLPNLPDFDCFNFNSQSSLIPSSNQNTMSEEQIQTLKDLLIVDDETFLFLVNQALDSSSSSEFLSSSHLMADIFGELLQSPSFEIKLIDYCIFYLYCPFILTSKSKIEAASLSLSTTQNLIRCIFAFLKDHLKNRDYLIFQHRSVFEFSRLKIFKESPLNELYMQKTDGLISFTDLLINLADESSEMKSVSLLKPHIDSLIKDICPKLKNLTILTEPQKQLFQPRIITQKSCNILLVDYHNSSLKIPEIQLVNISNTLETLQSEIEINNLALKQFNDKVFLTNEKSDGSVKTSLSPKNLLISLEILESSVGSISTLLSNRKPVSGPNDKLYIQIIQKLQEKTLDTQVFKEFFINLFSLAEYLAHKKSGQSRSEQGESLVTCIIKLCFHFYTLIHIQKKFNNVGTKESDLSEIEIFQQTPKEKIDPLDQNFTSLRTNSDCRIDFKSLFVNLCIKSQDLLSKLFLDNDCSDKLLCEFKVVQKSLRSVFDFSTKKKIFIEAIDTLFKKSGVSESSRTIIINRNDLLRSTLSQFKGLTINELRETVKIVFENESGIDAGGLTREWYSLIVEEIFNPRNGLFKLSNHQTSLQPHPSASAIPFHLQYLELAGIIVAKAILSGCVVGVNFTKSFIKHIMQRKIVLDDLKDLDGDLTKSLEWILENPVEDLEQSFIFQSEYFGQKIDKELVLNGNNFVMNEENKKAFVKKVCEFKMRDEISEEIKAFKRGFHVIISPNFLQFLEVEELDLLIRGISSIDIGEMKTHAVMRYFAETDSELISWIWDVLNELSPKDLTAFLMFISGSSRLQYGGFKENPLRFEKAEGDLNRLPVAHTCYRSIEILPYKSKEDLKQKLLYAIYEGKEGFMIV